MKELMRRRWSGKGAAAAAVALAAVLGCAAGGGWAAEPMGIDPLWKSAEFRRAFTGSYGIDSRIEPKVTSGEKAVLEAVAAEMAAGDRDGATSKLAGSSLLDTSPALIFTLANIRFEQGEAEDAAEGFGRALALYPNFRDAHRNLAVAKVQLGMMGEAEPHLRRALELGAQDGLTLGLLGYCHASAGHHQAALQAYRLAQLTMPDELQWKVGEAGALLALDELEAAASLLESVLEILPGDVGIWVNLGNVRLRQGEAEMAIADMEIGRRLGGLDAAEVISLGHLYLNASLVGSAMGCYREGIRSEKPAELGEVVAAAERLARFGRWEEAKEIAAEIHGVERYAAELDGEGEGQEAERIRFGRVRAMVELEIGDPEAGAALVGEILKKDPLDGRALMLLARYRASEEKHEEAEMLYEQAARIPEFEAEALRELGALLVERGDFEAALKPLRKTYEIAPDEALKAYLETVERLADGPS